MLAVLFRAKCHVATTKFPMPAFTMDNVPLKSQLAKRMDQEHVKNTGMTRISKILHWMRRMGAQAQNEAG